MILCHVISPSKQFRVFGVMHMFGEEKNDSILFQQQIHRRNMHHMLASTWISSYKGLPCRWVMHWGTDLKGVHGSWFKFARKVEGCWDYSIMCVRGGGGILYIVEITYMSQFSQQPSKSCLEMIRVVVSSLEILMHWSVTLFFTPCMVFSEQWFWKCFCYDADSSVVLLFPSERLYSCIWLWRSFWKGNCKVCSSFWKGCLIAEFMYHFTILGEKERALDW